MECFKVLPHELLGQVLQFLKIKDIIQLERSVASHASSRTFHASLLFLPIIEFEEDCKLTINSWRWFQSRKCRIKNATISCELLAEIALQPSLVNSIELTIQPYQQIQDITQLEHQSLCRLITHIIIRNEQKTEVIKYLFSKLTEAGSPIQSIRLEEFEWLQYAKGLGSTIQELFIPLPLAIFITASSHQPLTTIATTCPLLQKLHILEEFSSMRVILRNTDIMVFATKCPLLEELWLSYNSNLTDESVVALAQHCPHLRILDLNSNSTHLSHASLVALSQRNLPHEGLLILRIPDIPSTEEADQCTHTLSRIRQLSSTELPEQKHFLLQYMTGIKVLKLNDRADNDIVSKLLAQSPTELVELRVDSKSAITEANLFALLAASPHLRTLYLRPTKHINDTTVVQVAALCPQLQELTLGIPHKKPMLTDRSVLALSEHCSKLRLLDMREYRQVSASAVLQLVQRCRQLQRLLAHRTGLDAPTVQALSRIGRVRYEGRLELHRAHIQSLREIHSNTSKA